jgi:hypothetical protein
MTDAYTCDGCGQTFLEAAALKKHKRFCDDTDD